jgi:Putative peptidoglycan binding domain
MNKKSFDRSTWEKIKQKLLTIPDAGDPSISGAKSKLNTFKFEVVEKGPDGKPDSIAYVTGEDANNNGIVDTINIVAPKFEDLFKKMYEGKTTSQIDSIDKEYLKPFLKEVANTILHEAKHLKDAPLKLDPTQPGGGFAPETAAQAAEHHSIDNKSAKRNLTMKKQQTLDILTKLASDLKGKDKNAAREVNALISKYAQQPGPEVSVDTSPIQTSGKPLTQDEIIRGLYTVRGLTPPGQGAGIATETARVATPSVPTKPRSVLKIKSRGPEVAYLQQKLNLATGSSIAEDGIFGEITEELLKKYQKTVGIPATGIADESTYRKLYVAEKQNPVSTGAFSTNIDLTDDYNPLNMPSELIRSVKPDQHGTLAEGVITGRTFGPGGQNPREFTLKNKSKFIGKIIYTGEDYFIVQTENGNVKVMFRDIEDMKNLSTAAHLKDDSLNKIASLKEQYAEVLTFEKRHPFGRNFKG